MSSSISRSQGFNWQPVCKGSGSKTGSRVWNCGLLKGQFNWNQLTANLRTKILDLRGFDSSILLILRAGILTSRGIFPESLSQDPL